MSIINVLAGIAVLVFGRKLFWLFVGCMGFLAGIDIATRFFSGQPDWMVLVIAIAAGIIDGVGFGDNTKAALLTRGMAEITRLGVAMGANPLTFTGLSGIGDLIVTCTSRHSRNRHVGEQIGKGKTLKQVLDEMVMVAEGVRTTRSVYDLAKQYDIDMPISSEVYRVLFEDKDPKKAVYDLMTRNPKAEDWG